MLEAIGESLPLAIAIAFSPLAIVAVVVMLLSDYPRGSSVSFVLGWAAGIALVSVAGFGLAALVPDDTVGLAPTVAPVTLMVLGVTAVVLAIRQWRRRPGTDDVVPLPGWMKRIDSFTAVRAFVFGVLLAATKPKNLILAFGVGVSVESAGLEGTDALFVLGVFVAFSSLSIAAPVVAFLALGVRIRDRLDRLKDWMVRNNSVMLGVVLLFVGVILIGNALTRWS